MNLDIKAGVRGQYQVTVIRGNGSVDEYPVFDNLMLDAYFTDEVQFNGVYISVGTGATPPAVTDTALESPVGTQRVTSTRSNTRRFADPNYEGVLKCVATWTLGTVVGTLAEIGWHSNSSGAGGLKSRSLIKDGNGDPTTIELTIEDQLLITYTLIVSAPPIDITYSGVDLDGVSTDIRLTSNGMLGSYWFYSIEFFDPADIIYGYIVKFLAPQTIVYPPTAGEDLSGNDSGGKSSSSVETKTRQSASTSQLDVLYQVSADSTALNLRTPVEHCIITSNSGTVAHTQLMLHFDPPFVKDNTKSFKFTIKFSYMRS